MKPQVILISGKQGSGKTTIAKALYEKLFNQDKNNFVKLMRFADTLYEMHDACREILNKYMPVDLSKKDGNLLQLLGTEWGRKTLGDDVWVKIAQKNVDIVFNYLNDDSHRAFFIFQDCRFENEFDAFPEALKVRLWCSEPVRKRRAEMWRENTNHPSETGLDAYQAQNKFDLLFYTEGESVEYIVNKILEELKARK